MGNRGKSMSPKNKALSLPQYIRNELRTVCAMRGYSKMNSGKRMSHNDQWEFMARFFHDRPPKYPSQIELLVEGRMTYADLFEKI